MAENSISLRTRSQASCNLKASCRVNSRHLLWLALKARLLFTDKKKTRIKFLKETLETSMEMLSMEKESVATRIEAEKMEVGLEP